MHAYALQKPLSSVTFAEESLGYRLTGKVPSPRAKNRALGEKLTPLVAGRRYFLLFLKKKRRSFPSATLEEETLFPKRRSPGTRRRNPLPRAPQLRHSGKKSSSPSATTQALGEKTLFRECRSPCTRGSQFENPFFFLLFHVNNKPHV